VTVWRGALPGFTLLGAALLSSSTGCGGGAPLLYPAHTLPQSSVSFAAGTSGHVSLGGLAAAEDDLKAAAAVGGGAVTSEERAGFVRGALARFAVAPGVAPFVAARAGLGHHSEAGFSYLGRAVRLDARRAFEWPKVALSLGLAGTGALSRAGDKPTREVAGQDAGLRSVEVTSLRGYGFELPVVFGYRSSADVVLLWAGVRGGMERDSFDLVLVETPDEQFGTSGSAMRYWGGALVGFAVGLSPIQVRVELDAAYQSIHGNLLTGGGELTAEVAGWALTPAMAISAKF
jgi:hypothetical protein